MYIFGGSADNKQISIFTELVHHEINDTVDMCHLIVLMLFTEKRSVAVSLLN